jgi:hypothetical protein
LVFASKLPGVAVALTSLALTQCAVCSCVSEGVDLSSMSSYSFSADRWTPRRSESLPGGLVASYTRLLLMPLLHSAFVLSGFLVQHCPGLVPDDLVPCAAQEWYGGQILPGPINALGPLFRLTSWPYGWMPILIPLLQCSESFHCSLFCRDLLMHRYGLSHWRLATYPPDRPPSLLGRPSSLFARASFLLNRRCNICYIFVF